MYAIVDIETTGGYAENHRMTEIAIIHHDGIQITHRFHTLINPGRRVPYFITGLTGITDGMLQGAPSFAEIAREVFDHLKDKIFVAHNAHFDYSFLKKELDDAGILWATKKLCTVRLGRKIIPGLDSYSLGRLAESLGVAIQDRHRAGGDAEATARIFDILLKRDDQGIIAKALKKGSGEALLPPNLPKAVFDKLPPMPGVYYFLDAFGEVIYVGKANNIKKRIMGHFAGDAQEWNRSNIRNEIHDIRFVLSGNELIALILEAEEIRKRWPRYNLAQKHRMDQWGIFTYEDRNGYQRFVVNGVTRNSKPLLIFRSKGEAWNFLWTKVKESDLCPKLSGLQTAKGPCYAHQSGSCRGACNGMESGEAYNQRTHDLVNSFAPAGDTLAIVGKGREAGEKSLVLVDNGVYAGFGFLPKEMVLTTLGMARKYASGSKENYVAQNLVNSILQNPGDREIISFE